MNDFKIRCWIPENNEMIYSDKLSENESYCMYFGDDGFIVEYSEYPKLVNDYKHCWDWNIVKSIPMPTLQFKDIYNNEIYEEDILQSTWSDYNDPSGIHYPSDKLVYFIADIGCDIPRNVRIVGNKYETPILYDAVLKELG